MYELGDGCFALLSEETSSYAHTLELAHRLADAVAQPIGDVDESAIRASVGVAFPHLPDETAEDFLANAERALDLARNMGGRRVEVVIGSGPGSSDASIT